MLWVSLEVHASVELFVVALYFAEGVFVEVLAEDHGYKQQEQQKKPAGKVFGGFPVQGYWK